MLLLCGAGQTSVVRAQARINELDIAPKTGRSEFVELYISSQDSLDLRSLGLQDARNSTGLIRVPDSDSGYAQPAAYIVLAQDPELIRSEWPESRVFEVRPWPTLNNSGDISRVLHDGKVIDEYSYSSADYIRGISLERIDPMVPAEIESNWSSSISSRGATPGSENSIFVLDIDPPDILDAWFRRDSVVEVRFSEPVRPQPILSRHIQVNEKPFLGTVQVLDQSTIALFPVATSSAPTLLTIADLEDFRGNKSGPVFYDVALLTYESELLITEIQYDPSLHSDGSRQSEWLEIFNRSGRRKSLAGMTLVIGKGTPETQLSVELSKERMSLDPGKFILVHSRVAEAFDAETCSPFSGRKPCPNIDVLLEHSGANLTLNNNKDSVVLYGYSSDVVDKVNYDQSWQDGALSSTRGYTLERQLSSVVDRTALSWASSYAQGGTPGNLRDEDEPESWSLAREMAGAYPGKQSIYISEIMFDPILDPEDGELDQVEFLEFVNTSSFHVDLNGMSLVSGGVDTEQRDTLRLVYRPTRLAPGEIAVAFHVPGFIPDGLSSTRSFFSDVYGDSESLGSVAFIATRSALGLSQAGEFVMLMGPGPVQYESLRYSNDWHHPLVENTTGRSLERIDLTGPSNEPFNWTTSTSQAGASPGLPNSVAINRSSVGDIGDLNETVAVDVEPLTITPSSSGVRSTTSITVTGGPTNGSIEIQIYDLHGRVTSNLVPGDLYPGRYRTYWNGLNSANQHVPSGIYIVFVQMHDPHTFETVSIKKPISVFNY